MDVAERFLKYISIPTNSSSKTNTFPSTNTQWNLASVLVEDLKEMNLDEVYLDKDYCYVYGFLKGLADKPKIGFIAHMDTSEDVTDENINPQIISNYNGESIRLNETKTLDVNKNPDLKKQKGKTLITTDGNTLLGADDKAGIAEIMTMLNYITENNIPHGDIYVAFTPDEEIGVGTKFFDLERFKADFAYTVDGYDAGEISYENFNAARINVEIQGVATHLGNAKNVMVNSQLIANEIINQIPKEYPQTTEGYEGYYHIDSIAGSIENTKLQVLIRDFKKDQFENRKQVLRKIVEDLNKKYENCIKIDISDTYYNMHEVIANHMHLVENAKQAMKEMGVVPLVHAIRGGTDGAELSYLGLPCPNLGTGGNNFHSIYEYISIEDMEKTVDILIGIVKIYS